MSSRDSAAAARDVPGRWRGRLVLLVLLLAASVLVGRAVQLQVMNYEFLAGEGDARHLRMAKISAHRGPILDRNGEPLAVSTPVDSIWANPQELAAAVDDLPRLAEVVGRDSQWLLRRITRNMSREFVYLRRHMRPDEAAAVMALDLPGVHVLREYRRYYPAGEVAGHVLGFTNIDDVGQEGLELAFNDWLRGEPGTKQVLKDRLGRTIADVERIKAPRPGQALVTSLDLNVQYLAYRELKRAIQDFGARSGSIVVLDIPTGEVLAMANQPSYNPNDRSQYAVARYRNRAATDIYEPGSSFKPLVIAAALESGSIDASTTVNTSPGYLDVGRKRIEDTRDHGVLDAAGVLARSSNVGISKIALGIDPENLWSVLSRFGLGKLTSSGFPGESAGLLNNHRHWRAIGQATLGYGYGLSVTPLQLVQAYAVIGAGGQRHPVTFVRQDRKAAAESAIRPETATALLDMLETVVGPDGTGQRAAVTGFRVAGKTGTARKFAAGGYTDKRHTAFFAGIAPVSNPRLALVVVIDEPDGERYYGGQIAAPVFSAVMGGALRLLAVTPDASPATRAGAVIHASAAAVGDTVRP